MGKEVEVNLLIDYIVVVRNNGVGHRRLAALEKKQFPHLDEELRVMPKYATSFDIVAEKAHAEGHAEGSQEAFSKMALRMLKEGEPEAKICRMTGLSSKEVQLLKRSIKR